MTLEEKLAAFPLLLNNYGGSAERYEAECTRSAEEARRIYAQAHPEKEQS